MTISWQDILEQQKTLITDAYSLSNFIPLPQLGVLHISGDEAQSYLQNLLTNDVNALAINQSQLSGFCNAKGRLFAIFQLIRREGFYQIVLPKVMCSVLQQRLSMFILRAKVTISDESENMACIGLSPQNSTELEQLQLPVDMLVNYEQKNRHMLISPIKQINELLPSLQDQQWGLASHTLWEQLDIEAGTPTIFLETKEKFTPQQVNLDLVNGVSFSKGCYPGQEVVARLHYLGKPSRRMFIAQATTAEAITAADEVTTESGDIAGHVVRSHLNDDGTALLLLSIKLSEQEKSLRINTSVPVILTSN